MENKSLMKYYLIGAIVLVVVIVIIVLSLGHSKPAGQNTQTANTANTPISNSPAPSNNTPAPIVNSTPPPAANNELIGTWVSSVAGKGMQGSGTVTLKATTDQIVLASDVNLVVQKVENNIGTGTITFSNSCLTTTVSAPGKPDVTNPTQCLKTFSQPAVMQITGNTFSYSGKSELGANISLAGTFTGDSMSGTFTRTGSSGIIKGTFNLTRAKN